MFIRRLLSTLAAVCLVGFAVAATAQDGRISGAVTDDTGGALPGVTVEAVDSGGRRSIAVTDRGGQYSFAGLAADEYTVTFTLPGFERVERAGVVVGAGMTATLDVSLELGGLFEQVVVTETGTAIDAPAINMPHAVTLVNRESLEERGSTQLVDLFKSMGVSHGVVGERSSWYNSNQPTTLTETVANVNLRGLGASRTLVLLNGRRHVSVPARLIGGRFVDINTIPAIAIGRLEVLKEGASATYGSDAVGGVANFVTRKDFRGFEVKVGHDSFDGGGDTTVAGIWGGAIGSSSLILAAERVGRQELQAAERPEILGRLDTHERGNRAGWSSLGNPGTFSVGAPVPWTADVFDPRCEEFGGQDEGWTCRFRYAPYDNLIEKQQHIRVFGEINGTVNDRTNYHLEGLWSDARIPGWYTTPSYPPFPFTGSTVMEVGADHPGRQAFCGAYASDPKADPSGACANSEPWYFNGRPFGNSGPGRTLSRQSEAQRIAATVDGDFEIAGRSQNWDFGLSYSRASGNYNLPAIYTDRYFRALRGFGGPNCGVGVRADPTSPAGMVLGPRNGAVAGAGDCLFFNPFSNAIEFSEQPGAAFENTANPDFRPELANSEALRNWLDEEVDLVSTTDLFVADLTLSGNLIEDTADFAIGYQYRATSASGDPNDPGDVTMNPCPVTGDTGCAQGVRFGPYLFTNVHRPYEADQTVQRIFGELALRVGPRLDTQIAANYEFYDTGGRIVDSFNPKVALRLQLAESLAYSLSLRSSVQTTFRAPSLDDLNTSPLTTLEWIGLTGAYQAVDRFGSPDLDPETAFTYNAGAVLFLESGVEATVDYWSYDFENVIGSMPYDAVSEIYASGSLAAQDAVSRFIICPGGRASELEAASRCAGENLQRIQIDLVNWPGLTTSGLDFHLGSRFDIGSGQEFSVRWDATYTRDYTTKTLELEETGLTLYEEGEAAGFLNFAHPIAVPLPKWKQHWSVHYSRNPVTVSAFLNQVSSYEDDSDATTVPVIAGFRTLDMSILWRVPARGFTVGLYGMNLTDESPPWVNIEQGFDGFTHDAKGRRLKAGITYSFGS